MKFVFTWTQLAYIYMYIFHWCSFFTEEHFTYAVLFSITAIVLVGGPGVIVLGWLDNPFSLRSPLQYQPPTPRFEHQCVHYDEGQSIDVAVHNLELTNKLQMYHICFMLRIFHPYDGIRLYPRTWNDWVNQQPLTSFLKNFPTCYMFIHTCTP